jgi:hypothetical protein
MDVVIERIAGAEASLFSLIHRVQDHGAVELAQCWLEELRAIHGYLLSVQDPLRANPPDGLYDHSTRNDPPEPNPPLVDETGEYCFKLVEEALRTLNRPELARSELITLLACSVASAQRGGDERSPLAATPQAQARALREVIGAAIDRLKPADSDDATTADHYEVIHLKYRRGMETKQIADRLHVGEATVFRRRKEAIDAMVEDLRGGEALLRTAESATAAR